MSKGVKIISPQKGFQEKFVRSNVDFAIGGGVLNPQPLDSLIATPKGFVRMGDVKAGDIISNPSGGRQKVNFVIDRGLQECVEFTLRDGRKVQGALSHHWVVIDSEGNELDIDSCEIIKRLDSGLTCLLPYTNPERGVACVESYNLIGEKETRCINVSCDEHIYLTDNYIVTRNCGKAQPLDSHVLTPNGFIRMGDLKIGDVVCGSDGGTQTVLDIYERGKLETYSIMFDDGTVVECCPEHLWTVFDSENQKYVTVEAQSILKNKDRYTLPLAKGIRLQYDFFLSLSYNDRMRSMGYKASFEGYSKENKKFCNFENIGKKPMRCILVSNKDHLYITDGFNLTHNTYAAILSVAEPSMDGRFRGLFLRNNLGDAKAAGGILDTFKEIYGKEVEVVESGDPRVTFKKSGAKIDVTHVSDQSRDKVLQRFKGRQYDFIYFDEGTGFTWECFTAICTRNRGTAKWTGKIRMTTNPDRNHWLRIFLDWYIGIDGFIREDREGVVRYFYIDGETVKDVVWGDSKYEVYQKCKYQIDKMLAKVNGKTGNSTYEDVVKSFTFYLGRMSENKSSLENNKGYVGAVAMSGGRNSEQLLEGNWNVSPSDVIDACVTSSEANEIFTNDPQVNGDRWITCDLADYGTDNFVALAWNGFHVEDVLILSHTTPRENAENLKIFAAEHDVVDDHIIFDGTCGRYINDYIEDAIPFISAHKPIGMYGRMFLKLKDECYARLIEMIKRNNISVSDVVARMEYVHQKLKSRITIQNEIIEELQVIRFKPSYNGKKTLFSKKEMNYKLGKERSMDMTDPMAMRMYPVLEYPYGEEIEKSLQIDEFNDYDDDSYSFGKESIFDKSTWY